MARGQYDRAAAKAKRDEQRMPDAEVGRHMANLALRLAQEELAAANAEIARLKRLCQTHGLMIDG